MSDNKRRRKRKAKVSSINTGYKEFVSGLARYIRENDLKILKGKRGKILKISSRIWKELKGKPDVLSNIDVIIPQYIETGGLQKTKKKKISEEKKPQKSLEQRAEYIATDFSTQQFYWWQIKTLYGLWKQNANTDVKTDNLVIIDLDGATIEITEENNAAGLYRILQDEAEKDSLNKYCYLVYENVVYPNEKGGIDVIFRLETSEEYLRLFADKSEYDWSEEVQKRWNLIKKKKEEREEKKEIKKKEEKEEPQWLKQRKEKERLEEERKSRKLDDLIKYKQSIMEDIKFAKEIGEDYSEDLIKLKEVKRKIDELMK